MLLKKCIKTRTKIFINIPKKMESTIKGLIGGGLGAINIPAAQKELAQKYRANKMICRNCYSRLPLKAHNCRKKRCGHCANIRPKKKLREMSGKNLK